MVRTSISRHPDPRMGRAELAMVRADQLVMVIGSVEVGVHTGFNGVKFIQPLRGVNRYVATRKRRP